MEMTGCLSAILKTICAVAVVVLVCCFAFGTSAAEFEFDYYTDGAGTKIATSLWVPDSYDPEKEYALLIYLHNVGGRGEEPYFKGNPFTAQIIEKYGDEFIIFAPRCPSAYRWAEADWATGTYNYEKTPISKPMMAVLDCIYNDLELEYSIDEDRIYAFGDSMGGGGVWDMMLRDPELLAAAIPVCGYNDPTQAENIREDLALWVFHTIQDESVNVQGDQQMVAALQALGRNVTYTEYDISDPEQAALFGDSPNQSTNWEHWAWVPAYQTPELVEWLVVQTQAEPEPVPETDGDATIGIIGGADGPTAVFVTGDWTAVIIGAIAVVVLIAAAIVVIVVVKKKKK